MTQWIENFRRTVNVKKEPKWFADIQGKDNMVAIGAASPHDPVFGGLIGINIWGDPINCLIYPNVSENTVKALIAKMPLLSQFSLGIIFAVAQISFGE